MTTSITGAGVNPTAHITGEMQDANLQIGRLEILQLKVILIRVDNPMRSITTGTRPTLSKSV